MKTKNLNPNSGNTKTCSECEAVKSNKYFPRTLTAPNQNATPVCYQCESELFNPVITGRLVA